MCLSNVYPKTEFHIGTFDDPKIPDAPKDASAAAVAASGMLELSGFVKDKVTSDKYKNAGQNFTG